MWGRKPNQRRRSPLVKRVAPLRSRRDASTASSSGRSWSGPRPATRGRQHEQPKLGARRGRAARYGETHRDNRDGCNAAVGGPSGVELRDQLVDGRGRNAAREALADVGAVVVASFPQRRVVAL